MDHLNHDAHVNDLHHQWIPRDGEGNPEFLILPVEMRAQYDQNMAQCEAAWRAGEPLAVAEAVTWTFHYRQVVPAWLEAAVVELAMNRRTKSQAARNLAAVKRLHRYMYVRDAHNSGRTWEESYAVAANDLKCSEDTAKADYAAVRRDLKAGRSGKFFFLKDRRYRDSKPG